MNVLDYLNSQEVGTYSDALQQLTNEYGIKVSQNEMFPDQYCLNYCQIESAKHKFDPIVRECQISFKSENMELNFNYMRAWRNW